MVLFNVPESLFLTILLAALSGIFLTFATAATHYPSHIDRLAKTAAKKNEDKEENVENFNVDMQVSIVDVRSTSTTPALKSDGDHSLEAKEDFNEDIYCDESATSEEVQESQKEENKMVSKKMWKVAYAMNLVFAAIGGTLNLVGTWFGPVSLFVPIKQVCQIISGMITFSYILKTEPKPSKDTSVGNSIIMLSAIMLIFVGPKVRDEPIDIDALLNQDKTILCGGIMLLAFGVLFPFQFLLSCTNVPTTDRVNFIFLLLTEVVSSIIGNSCSKLLPLLGTTNRLFAFNLIMLLLAIFTVAFSSVLRSTVILSQIEYLPLMLSGNIFLNGLVGLLVWEDDIINTGGYTCTYFFFVLGIYLVSDYGYEILPGKPVLGDQSSPENQNAVTDGLIHGRARIIQSERQMRSGSIMDLTDSSDTIGDEGKSVAAAPPASEYSV